ncbi:SAM-dependent methyltransferase [Nodularia sphaerocarpa]|uniref:SAM-dependent methyltransferase n=1 Tax=Nodularia sphaerocarpa TaxID=137816 RepID=UPI001EFBBA4E|nr:class I SAM-dependent methyltransferase [Nodularia sphaerocarpa]MDB9374741.1 class I SAM-dependent methyltransferase [Nodularia sphaerocarpa CS-585]MDB9379351.1 class I SAM-dependent methyltransferase [Nodularia sphaerocarpa CS-585A2]ULP74635.1 Cyclopropane-fatty-acyl-phospholipid synthase [Nodularia sphaerocarpa UHCC 0038]
MIDTNQLQEIEKHIPLIGDINNKNPLAYQATRGAVEVVNTVQMAIAEAYINGLEIPDSTLRTLFDTCMPVFFKYFPSLLAPYEWVLKETDHIAEGSRDLMKIQYDLPQAMLNRMLGEGKLIYPKYSMGLWEKGALNLEQSQIDMIDDVIEKLDIQDGDHILDFGCGWGCVPNYILSKFPNVKVTGLNLSHEQCEYMRQKMQDPESFLSSGRFILFEGDLNDANFETKFDKILSIGVFCHVGNLTNSFEKLASFLKDNGKVFIHIITVRTPNNISSAYTHKYIFPHGRYWNYDAVPSHKKNLKTVRRWYLNGSNYSQTFATWLNNFDNHQETVKHLNYGIEYAKFRRIWRFYLIWFVRNFASCDGEYNGNGQYLMVHS